MRAQNAIFGNSAAISETPKDADISTHALKHGDVMVFATDGVWDNLSPMDTLNIVTPLMEKGGYWGGKEEGGVNTEALRTRNSEDKAVQKVDSLPADLAYAVMRAAKLAGLDTRRDGPFAREVHRYYPGENWHGGKHDDIAVIVCVAIQDGPDGDIKPIKAKL